MARGKAWTGIYQMGFAVEDMAPIADGVASAFSSGPGSSS